MRLEVQDLRPIMQNVHIELIFLPIKKDAMFLVVKNIVKHIFFSP